MCEYSKKLMALLDGELPPGEAIDVERHLDACAGCRNRLRAYEQLSHCVEAYCDARLDASAPGAAAPGKSVSIGVGAAAVVAAVAILLFVLRVMPRETSRVMSLEPVEQPEVSVSRSVSARAVAAEIPRAVATPVKKIHRHPATAPAQVQEANWAQPEPAIEIAIPADAVLPPGAVPEGVAFVVNMRIAADGSARQSFVWP